MRRRSNRRDTDRFPVAGRLAATVAEHPREFVAVVMSTISIFAIVINALFLQKGPHPAPIFATGSLLQHEAAMPPPNDDEVGVAVRLNYDGDGG